MKVGQPPTVRDEDRHHLIHRFLPHRYSLLVPQQRGTVCARGCHKVASMIEPPTSAHDATGPAWWKQIPVWGWLVVGALAIIAIFAIARATDDGDTETKVLVMPTFDLSNDSSDFQENAESFIESTEVESQAGTTFTAASCEEPAEIEAGELFTCTAVDADGATWDFDLVVKSENSYEITSGQPRP